MTPLCDCFRSCRFSRCLVPPSTIGRGTAPRRRQRWIVNLGLAAIDALCLRLVMPWLAIDAALWAQAQQFGLLFVLKVPLLLAAVIAFLSLHLMIYCQHRLLHRIGILWRLHRVHHTDLALEVSSAARFHPLEILLSMAIKIGAVLLLGAAPLLVLIFEIVLSSFAILTHANIAVPERLDCLLRKVFGTLDMHRIHHSVLSTTHDGNCGLHVSWWDRVFGSYRENPEIAQSMMLLGLESFPEPVDQRLSSLLQEPFAKRQASVCGNMLNSLRRGNPSCLTLTLAR